MQSHDSPSTSIAPVAILIVIGGDDPQEGSWIELCLSRIAMHTAPALYQLYLWSNNPDSPGLRNCIAKHAPQAKLWFKEPTEYLYEYHVTPLQRLYERAVTEGHSWIVTMDSDAHPIKAGWLDTLMKQAAHPCVLAGVWRDELSNTIAPYIHPSGLCVRQDFINALQLRFDTSANPAQQKPSDALSDLTEAAITNGFSIAAWHRSNGRQFHKLIGGIYADAIYHHGAGSREYFLFWGEQDSLYQRRLNTLLGHWSASLLMRRYDDYIAYLRDANSDTLWQLSFLRWLQNGNTTLLKRSLLASMDISRRLHRKLCRLFA
jgi:hypothetical protein